MQEKPAAAELAQKALELLNETDNLEEEKNWSKAIEKYQQAADYLKQSGYLPHRIEDIYKRIAEIKDFLEQEKQYQMQTQQVHLEQVQEQAFAILEAAKKLETDGYFEDAIQQYMSAIKLLVESGWTETQLENLKSKILSLTQNLERQKVIQKQQAQIPIDSKPQYIAIDDTQPVIDKKSEQVKLFEAKRKKEEQIQNESFELIDKAKIFEKEKRYDNAIKNYQEAIRLLNSIGWTDQTKNLQTLIGKLRKDKENYERIEAQRKGKLYFEGREQKDLKDKNNDQLRTIVLDDICIWAEILHDFNNIEKVEFYYNGRLQFTDTEPPFKWILNKFSLFNHRIEIISYSYAGQTASDWIDILFINPRIRN